MAEPLSPIRILQEIQILTYLQASAMVVLLYDIVLTCGCEWEKIWRARWTAGKVLYIVCRYYGAFVVIVNFIGSSTVQHDLKLCKLFMGFNVAGGALVVSFAINGITVMRLFALYERSKKVLFALLLVVTVTLAMQLYGTVLMTKAVINSAFFPSLDLHLPGCFSTEPVAYGIILWASYLSCSLILFGFMIVKFFRVSYQRKSNKARLIASPTIVAFYRSGTMWFFCLTAIVIIHACSFHNLVGPLRNYTIPWITVVQSVLGSRLVLNLRVDRPDQKTDISTRLGRLWFADAEDDDDETMSVYQ